MSFWIILYFVFTIIYTVQYLLKDKDREFCIYIVLFIIWFVGAFRYNIGVDYISYETRYDIINTYSIPSLSIIGSDGEPTFVLTSIILNYLGFGPQMLFVVYHTIIIAFLYLGIKKYSTNNFIAILALLLYVAYPVEGGFFWDMNGMRQAAACSIFFWGSHFLQQKDIKKFILVSVVAVLFHYSAIIGFLILLLRNKNISFVLINILCVCGFLFNALGITEQFTMSIIQIVTSYIEKYEVTGLAQIQIVRFSLFAFAVYILYVVARLKIGKYVDTLVLNCSFVYVLLRIYTSFGSSESILSAIMHRPEAYFLPFFFIIVSYFIYSLVFVKKKKILLFVLSCLYLVAINIYGLRYIYNSQFILPIGLVNTNIDYCVRFDLFR